VSDPSIPRTGIIAVGTLALSIVNGSASGATTIDFILQQHGMADVTQAAYIDNGSILIKAAGGDPNVDLLFEQSSQTMTIVNHEEKSTLDLDAERVSTLAGQATGLMAVVRKQLTSQMENMSEEQRAQMQTVIESMGIGELMQPPPPPPGKKTLKQAGMRKVNGFTCNRTEVFEGSQKIAEVCSAPADVLGIPAEDFAVIESMRDMSELLREETEKISSRMGQGVPQFGHADVDGVPVSMVDKAGNSMAITAIRQGIGDVLVEKPAGYADRPMPTLPQIMQ